LAILIVVAIPFGVRNNWCHVYIEILDHEGLAELKLAFDMACNELRLGTGAKDVVLREHLAN
jgi:hypothetical protein